MSEIPYLTTPNIIPKFFEQIQTTFSIPPTVNKEWLDSVGYTSSNHRPIIPLLKALGFLDNGGKPTSRWSSYRDKTKSKFVLAEGIRQAYSNLFNTYHDAQNKDNEALRNFFSTKTNGGERVLTGIVGTFKKLVGIADFSQESTTEIEMNKDKQDKMMSQTSTGLPTFSGQIQPIIINVNIELALPATNDVEIYDNLFKSLKRNILTQEVKDE